MPAPSYDSAEAVILTLFAAAHRSGGAAAELLRRGWADEAQVIGRSVFEHVVYAHGVAHDDRQRRLFVHYGPSLGRWDEINAYLSVFPDADQAQVAAARSAAHKASLRAVKVLELVSGETDEARRADLDALADDPEALYTRLNKKGYPRHRRGRTRAWCPKNLYEVTQVVDGQRGTSTFLTLYRLLYANASRVAHSDPHREPETMRFSSPHDLTDTRACRPIIPIPAAVADPDHARPLAVGECPGLLERLAMLPDPRDRRGRRHTLASVLAVSAAAVAAGARSVAAIAEWGTDARWPILAALGVRCDPLTRRCHVPCEATIRRVLHGWTAARWMPASARGWPTGRARCVTAVSSRWTARRCGARPLKATMCTCWRPRRRFVPGPQRWRGPSRRAGGLVGWGGRCRGGSCRRPRPPEVAAVAVARWWSVAVAAGGPATRRWWSPAASGPTRASTRRTVASAGGLKAPVRE
ncbi:MAG TPA: transposase family protein [Actinomycetes bacterium]|nr:transposase family protein [Actinomycetes bacterium]